MKDINKLSQMLEKIMQDLFLKCLNLSENKIKDGSNETCSNGLNSPENRQQLKHVLKSYALLSKQRLAEQLFTDVLVKPYIEKVKNIIIFKYVLENLLFKLLFLIFK
jgi:hypothetical protein